MTTIVDIRAGADTIIRHHAIMAAGFGLVPVPFVDLAAVSGVQINMLRELAKLYEVPFSKDRSKAIIGALLGGGVPYAVSATPFVGSTLKAIPIVGSLLGAAVMPGLSSAATVALGRIFVNHFETGGNLLNLDVEAIREHFKKQFEAARSGRKSDDDAVEEAPTVESEVVATPDLVASEETKIEEVAKPEAPARGRHARAAKVEETAKATEA